MLAPSNDVLKAVSGISRQADGRVTIDVGCAYVPWRNRYAELSLGYEFFQGLQFQLTDFNLQDHRASAQLVIYANAVQLGILGQYDYYFLKDNSFLQEATGEPWLAVPEGDIGRTEVFYRMRRRDFLERPFSGVRDAFNHAPGVRQFLYLGEPDRYVTVGYRFDREDVINRAGNAFAYDGQEAEGGVGWEFPAAISVQVSYVYRYEGYAPASNGRHDDDHRVVAAIRKQLTSTLAVSCGYYGTLNDSSDPRFQYRRHVGSVTFDVRL